MKYKEPGPWDDEPDNDAFEAHGLECQMMRNAPIGHWCGYVVSPKEINDAESILSVHGGVTWDSDRLPWESRTRGIYVHVIGFDCGHSNDYSPHLGADLAEKIGFNSQIYRTHEYTKSETIRLAKQIAQILDGMED